MMRDGLFQSVGCHTFSCKPSRLLWKQLFCLKVGKQNCNFLYFEFCSARCNNMHIWNTLCLKDFTEKHLATVAFCIRELYGFALFTMSLCLIVFFPFTCFVPKIRNSFFSSWINHLNTWTDYTLAAELRTVTTLYFYFYFFSYSETDFSGEDAEHLKIASSQKHQASF